MIYKTVLLVMLAVIVMLAVSTAVVGRWNTRGRDETLIMFHRGLARSIFALLAVFVVLIEIAVRLTTHVRYDTFFVVHFSFAIPCFAGIAALNFSLDGLKYEYHGRLAYATLVLFTGTVLTGIPLIIWRL